MGGRHGSPGVLGPFSPLPCPLWSATWNPGASLPLVADYEGPQVAGGCLAVKACSCPRGPLSECIFLISMEVNFILFSSPLIGFLSRQLRCSSLIHFLVTPLAAL